MKANRGKCKKDPYKTKIRHPDYLGMILVYIGVPFARSPVSLFIPAFLFSHPLYTGVKEREEILRDKFGKEYKNYMKKVLWMFIPRII